MWRKLGKARYAVGFKYALLTKWQVVLLAIQLDKFDFQPCVHTFNIWNPSNWFSHCNLHV